MFFLVSENPRNTAEICARLLVLVYHELVFVILFTLKPAVDFVTLTLDVVPRIDLVAYSPSLQVFIVLWFGL